MEVLQNPAEVDAWPLLRSCAVIPPLLVLVALLISGAAKGLSSCWSRHLHEDRPKNGAGAAVLKPGMAQLVEEKLLLARIEQTKVLCHALAGLMGIMVITWLKNALDGMKIVNTLGCDVFVWCLLNFCVLVMVRPAIITVKVMEILMCALPVLFGLLASPLFCPAEASSTWLLMGNIVTVVVCLVRRPPRRPRESPMFYLCAIIFAVCATSNLWHFPPRGFTRPDTSHPKGITASVQSAVVMAGLWYGSLWGRSDRRLLATSLQLEEVRELYAAARALLTYSFDVIVEVDDVGNIISPASELSSLVLQPSKKLQGTQLADLFTREADRVQFLQRLRSPHLGDASLLESMDVGMQDASGCNMNLELLWFGFHRHSSRCFVVGVREFPSDCHEVPHSSDDNGIAACTAAESDEFSASGDWELSDSEPGLITVNAWAAGLPILAVSTSFILQFGRVPLGSPFMRCAKHPKELEGWVQTATNNHMHGEPQSEDNLLQLRLHKSTITARCGLVLPAETEDLDLERLTISLQPLSSQFRPCAGRGTPSRLHQVEHSGDLGLIVSM